MSTILIMHIKKISSSLLFILKDNSIFGIANRTFRGSTLKYLEVPKNSRYLKKAELQNVSSSLGFFELFCVVSFLIEKKN